MSTLTKNAKNEVVNNEVVNEILNAITKPTKIELHKEITLTLQCIENAIELSNLQRLRALYGMIKIDKTTFVIKERLVLRKLIRDSIFELAKLEDKNNVITEEISKKATEKQNATSGFNAMIDLERRSLGACLNTLNGALMLAKESPNKVYDFKKVNERFDPITGMNLKTTIEFNVKYDAIKFDIVNFARKNIDFYSEVLNLLQIADLGNLTEKKVNKFISDNLANLQNIKVEIKAKIEAEKKAKK
jgi:hypothetical protein